MREEKAEASDSARVGGRSADERGDASVCEMAQVANGAARRRAILSSDGYIMADLPWVWRSAS